MNAVTDPILPTQKQWLDRLVFHCHPTVVDVGANIGRFAEEILDRWADARVICFEPQPNAAEKITDRAEVRNVALGHTRETLRLYCNPAGTDMSATFHQEWRDGIDVPVERLDEQDITTPIDILKIDAEGNELAVMQGAGELLKPQRIRLVQWEFNPSSTAAGVGMLDFVELLAGRGYTVNCIGLGGEVLPITELDPPDETGNFHWELVAS